MRSGTVEGLNANGGVNHRCVTVELLTGETILISTEGKTACSAIWNRVEGELVARGVVHPQIFGLAIKTGSDWVFVDPDAKVSKYFPKEWKSTSQNNSGSISDNKTLVLYCRVHFYLDALPQSFDVVSLHHYYLQLRQNLIVAPRSVTPAAVELLTQPIAFAYQAELGDWRPCQETPIWAQKLKLGSALTRAHQALVGLTQAAARIAFIRAVMPQYNMHMYGMTLRTKDGKDAPVWIGVTPKGIDIYQNGMGCMEIPEHPKVTFLWANITKLYFERKKFEIRGRTFPWAGSTQKLSFTAASESVPRHLLILCRSTHQFHLSNHKILLTTELSSHQQAAHTKGLGSGSSSYLSSTGGESSCNSTLLGSTSSTTSTKNDEKMLDLSLWADGLLLAGGGESSEHQRVSVISNASSNTTSGIVSDRVYSLDGSEEDLDLREISSYCCPERHRTDNSTSLESLSQKHHQPPPRPHQDQHPHHHSQSHNNNTNTNGNTMTMNNVSSNSHVSTSNGTNLTSDGEEPSRTQCASNSGSGSSSNSAPVTTNATLTDGGEVEAKFWYCDSDCEDCDDAGPCRSSLLVRTIGEKRACAGHCECSSCMTEEAEELDLDGLDLSTPPPTDDMDIHILHTNTPSMVSEGTLKAMDVDIDICISSSQEGSSPPNQSEPSSAGSEHKTTTPTTPHQGKDVSTSTNKLSTKSTVVVMDMDKSKSGLQVGDKKVGQRDRDGTESATNCDCDCKGSEKDSIQKSKERLQQQIKLRQGNSSAQQEKLLRNFSNTSRSQREEDEDDLLDDPMEHVYGEICEDDPNDTNDCGDNNKTDDRQYFTINSSSSVCNSSSSSSSISNNKAKSKSKSKQEVQGNDESSSTTNNCRPVMGRKQLPLPNATTTTSSCSSSSPNKLRCKGKIFKELKSIKKSNGISSIVHSSSNCNSCASGKLTASHCKKTSFSTNNVNANVLGTKENGITPKIASLKCLKTQKGPSVSSTIATATTTSSLSSSWLPGGGCKMVGRKNALNSKKNNTNCNGTGNGNSLSSHHHHHYHGQDEERLSNQNDYVEFGEKLQQGRYPSTRTVSDNFDTDSDYVQLPPLFPRPLPKKPTSKLWKLVTKGSSNSSASTPNHCNSSPCNAPTCPNNKNYVHPPTSMVECHSMSTGPISATSTPGPAVNLNTLPRRHKLEHSLSISATGTGTDASTNHKNHSHNESSRFPSSKSNMTKVNSKSTTALHSICSNSLGSYEQPDPPPKPMKRHVSTNLTSSKSLAQSQQPVDARFIATKPQILVQTAYATAAPVAIPSQSHILFRSSTVLLPSTATSMLSSGVKSQSHTLRDNINNSNNCNNYQHSSYLQHSQSVDNIYDTVASEEPIMCNLFQNSSNNHMNCSSLTKVKAPSSIQTAPPPYSSLGKKPQQSKSSNSVVIKPNNYIDVHASAAKGRNRKSGQQQLPPVPTSAVNTNGSMALQGNNNSQNQGSCPPTSAVPNPTGRSVNVNRCGSVPNNLNNFLIGLQNLKPLSRAPIVHPAATSSSMSLSSNSQGNGGHGVHHNTHAGNLHTTSSAMSMSTSFNVPCQGHVQQQQQGMIPTGTGISQSTNNINNVNSVNMMNANANMCCTNNANNSSSASSVNVSCSNGSCAATNSNNSRYTTVYTSQLTRSQIQQFKAQLYSDMDYVIFPPKDPRVSQQEYYDSKSLSYTTLPGSSGSAAAYAMNDIPPPYLPPPPPYPVVTGNASLSNLHLNQSDTSVNNKQDIKPPRPAKTIGIKPQPPPPPPATVGSESYQSLPGGVGTASSAYSATSPSSYHHNSYGSIYNIGSNNSQCSSSQYAGGYYAAVGSLNLNAENIQRFLSTQSLAGSNISSAPIYYPCSTQSAPPLPPYNSKNGHNIIIENEMRKAVQSQLMNCRSGAGVGLSVGSAGNGSGTGPGSGSGNAGAGTMSQDRLRMKFCRSEESLYTSAAAVQPIKETEEKLQAIYNLPPPPPYNGTKKISPSDLDLASLRAKCQALELPLLRALCSDGALLTQTKPRTKIRPTAHAHPKFAPKQLSLPPKPNKAVPVPGVGPVPMLPTPAQTPSSTAVVGHEQNNQSQPPPLPPHLPHKPSKA